MNENYFILLGIDCSERDPNKISEAIKKTMGYWASMRNHPTKSNYASQVLAAKSDIEQKMSETSFLEEESARCKQIRLKQQKEKHSKFILEATMLIDKPGEICKEKLELFLKRRYKDISVNEAIKILKVKLVSYQNEESAYKDDGIFPLENSVMKQIRAHLEVIKKKDLFDFLELSASSSCSTIKTKAQAIYEVYSKKAKKEADVTVTVQLTALCIKHLGTEESKKRYLKSLEKESFNEIFKLVDTAAIPDKIISNNAFDKLIKQCGEIGIRKDKGEYYIRDYCKQKKYLLNISDNADYKKMIQCGICGFLNDSEANNCSNCSFPLKLKCPGCSRQVDSSSRSCSKCGFSIGDMPNAISLIKQARIEFANGNYEPIANLLIEAEKFWPDNVEIDTIKKQLKEQSEKQQKKKKEKKEKIEKIASAINILISNKKFVTVKSEIKKLEKLDEKPYLINTAEVWANNAIREARTLCSNAKIENNNERKLDLYLSALEICSDYPDALSEASKIPVDAPTGLHVTNKKRSISLEWNQLKSKKAVSFKIIRKTNSAPINDQDGEIKTETTNNVFTDTNTQCGISYFYAVYSTRGNSVSNTATIIGPILLIAEVTNLSSISGDKSIFINWKAPTNVKRLDVFKKLGGMPSKHGDGEKISHTSLTGFTDDNLLNEKKYGYSIFCVFEDINGKEYFSEGKDISCIPSAPPNAIKDLEYSITGSSVNLSWKVPEKGTVQILRSTKSINHSIGANIPKQNLGKLGILIPKSYNTTITIKKDFQGVVYFTAIVLHNETAIIGKEISLTSIEDVRNLKGIISSGKIYVEWDWPTGCKMVKIVYTHDAYIKNHKKHLGNSNYITKDEYDRELAFVIKQPALKNYYFTVFSCSKNGEEELLSSGKKLFVANGESVMIQYKVIRKNMFRSKTFVEIKAKRSLKLPEMKVVCKKGGLPTNENNGEVISIIKESNENATTHKVEIPDNKVLKNHFIKLFFTDKKYNTIYKLIIPELKDLELS